MKKILLPLLIWITCIGLHSQEVSDFLYVGNNVRYSTSTIDSNSELTGGAIQLTPEKQNGFAGNAITRIRFHQSSTQVESVKIFVSHSLSEPYEYTQDVPITELKKGWSDITLEKAFELDGKELYFGYQIQSKGSALGINSNGEKGLNDWYYNEGQWAHLSKETSAGMCIVGIVQGDKLPRYDIELLNCDVPDYQDINQPFSVKCIVHNLAAETIQEMTFGFQINGKEAEAKNVGNLNIPYLKSDTVTITDLMITEEDTVSFALSALRLNGHEDIDMSNNSYEQHIFCKENFLKRKVLIEMFSTEGCSNCPKAHERVEHIIEKNDRFTMVTHHSGFGEDAFTTDADIAYLFFYNNGALYAPALMLDRTNLAKRKADARGSIAKTPIFSIGNNLEYLTNYSLSVPAFVSIELDTKYDEESRTLDITVSGKSVLELPVSESRLNIYITEDSIPAIKQSGAEGGYKHNQTMRKNITEIWGDKVLPEEGFSKNYTFQVSKLWNAKNLNVVAFVSGYDEKDSNKCMIYNTDFKQLYKRNPPTDHIEKAQEEALSIHSQGSNIHVVGQYHSLNIYDMTGRKIATIPAGTNSIEASRLGNGLFLFHFETMDGTIKTLKTIIHE